MGKYYNCLIALAFVLIISFSQRPPSGEKVDLQTLYISQKVNLVKTGYENPFVMFYPILLIYVYFILDSI